MIVLHIDLRCTIYSIINEYFTEINERYNKVIGELEEQLQRHTDMKTLCEIIGMKRKYKKIINELGYLSTINDTMQSSDRIKQENRLSANVRASLLTFIKWKKDNHTGTLDDFEEYFENDEGDKCYKEMLDVI